MKKNGKNELILGCILLTAFACWTWMIQCIDVQSIGVNGSEVGFAALNSRFHELTGVHMLLYVMTDWLGVVPLFVCAVFGGIGLVQLIKRRSLFKVDHDLVFLGIYYVIVIFGYLIFEMIPINYRPILIEEVMEASYPSSTTLLVLSVMPTLVFQVKRRMKNTVTRNTIVIFSILFSVFMVVGRMISGVHWFTDIVGSVMLSTGVFYIYKAVVLFYQKER